MDTATTGTQLQRDESSTTFFIPGKISYHEVEPDFSMDVPNQPNTGQHWEPVLFVRPARPNMIVPIRKGLRTKVIDHLGNLVAGFQWHSIQLGMGTSWYGWVLLEELPPSFWKKGNGTGVIDDYFVEESNALNIFRAQKVQKKGGSRVGLGNKRHDQVCMEIDQNESSRASRVTSDEDTMETEKDAMDALMGNFQMMALGNGQ